MYFTVYLKKMLPEIVRPIEVALSQFEQDLKRMLSMRGKTGSLPELAGYIETLKAFHKSIDDLKYSIFDQSNVDTENVTKIVKHAVTIGVAKSQSASVVEKNLSVADQLIIRDVKEFFDSRIKRAAMMLKIAEDLHMFFGKK